MEELKRSLRAAPVVERNGYEYFVHGITDGVPPLEPAILQEIADTIVDRIDLRAVDTLVTPEAMGIHHATAVSLAAGIPLAVVRKRSYGFPTEVAVHQQTSYGEDELYLNGVKAGDRVVLIDDVCSSGGTIEAVCGAIEEAGAELVDVVVVVRRVDADDEDLDRSVTALVEVSVEDGTVVIDE